MWTENFQWMNLIAYSGWRELSNLDVKTKTDADSNGNKSFATVIFEQPKQYQQSEQP